MVEAGLQNWGPSPWPWSLLGRGVSSPKQGNTTRAWKSLNVQSWGSPRRGWGMGDKELAGLMGQGQQEERGVFRKAGNAQNLREAGGWKGAGRQQAKSGWKDARAAGGAEPGPDPWPAEEGSHQDPGRVRCWWAIGAACRPGLDGSSAAGRGQSLRTGTLDTRPPCAELPEAAPRMASLGPRGGQEAGLCQFRGHWPRRGPAQELEGVGTEGSPHRVADLTLRLGRQPSGPPRACVGLLEAAIPLESPCKPGAVYR